MSHLRPRVFPSVLLLLLVAATPAAAQDMLAFLLAEADLERELLADDLRQYGANRVDRQEAAAAVEEGLLGIDEALENGLVTLGQLEALEGELLQQEERLTLLRRQGEELRQRIYERLRRTALLGERIDGLRTTTQVRLDPVTGVWEMEVRPGNLQVRLQLNLNGTILNGSYLYLDGSASGSVRGIFAGDKITLERIDARRGFDSVWQGEIDPVRRELRGSWTATDLSGGGPGGGTWSARKVDPEEGGSDANEANDATDSEPAEADTTP